MIDKEYKNYPNLPENLSINNLDDNNSLKKMVTFVEENKTVIDFGCASGYLANLLKQRGCQVTGLEINPDAAEIARQYCEEVFVCDLDFDSLNNILGDRKFDVAVFGDVLEHLRNPWRVLEQTKDFLNPSGFIVASIPNIAHGAIRLALLEGDFNYMPLGILDNTHLRFFTKKTVEELFEKTGYFIHQRDYTRVPIFQENPLIPFVKRENFENEVINIVQKDKNEDILQFIIKAFPSNFENKYFSLKESNGILIKTNQETQSQLQETQSQLQETQSQLYQNQVENQKVQTIIYAMETSKFWKLRKIWLKFKSLSFVRFFFNKLNKSTYQYKYDDNINNVIIEPNNKYKELFSSSYQQLLHSFLLASGSKLVLPTKNRPLITIILVLYNRAELTFQCLRTICENHSESFEVIIVDNASSDTTALLLSQVEGAKIIYNKENYHFLLASNQAAKEAKGKYILFLNNDAQLFPGSIKSALNTIESSDDIGAVGGKILLLDGKLQEAGSIIWQDGSCLGYGRGDDPFAPMYMFMRDVDYCSGAFLLTYRELFLKDDGFDIDYQPAYYEETDYCLKLWEQGKRVVYDPNAIISHFEFASSQSSDQAIDLQKAHKQVFVRKHSEQLKQHYYPSESNILLARSSQRNSSRVLFIDDRVPHTFLGSGLPRSNEILQCLLELNSFVTFYPLCNINEEWRVAYQDIPRNVEIMLGYGIERLEEFLRKRSRFYDIILVSRPHNMKHFGQILNNHPQWFNNTKIIYDAEAVYALREVEERRLLGNKVSEAEIKLLVEKELRLAKGVDTIIAVSELEKEHFKQFGFNSVSVIGHTVPVTPTQFSFTERAGILFVGSFHHENSPNADSVFWFVKEILPLIQKQLEFPVQITIAGFNNCQKIFNLQSDYVQVLGKVDDLTCLYNRHRIFIAPTRFAAGIPLKVYYAAAHGIPIVATSLIATQLGWKDEKELLMADDPQTFASQCVRLYNQSELWENLRHESLIRISEECSRKTFIDKIHKILSPV